MDVFVEVPLLCFLEDMKDWRIKRISVFLATENGVSPLLFGALGFSVKGAKILTISVSSSDDTHFTQHSLILSMKSSGRKFGKAVRRGNRLKKIPKLSKSWPL